MQVYWICWERMKVADEIGLVKKEANVAVLQKQTLE
jgi:chorismate mutase